MELIIGNSSHLGRCVSANTYMKRKETSIQEALSENPQLFWVKSRLLDKSYWIMKKSPEGITLNGMLEDTDVPEDTIIDYLDELVLEHMSATEIRQILFKEKKRAFKDGQRSIQDQIKATLGLGSHRGMD